MRRGGYIQRHTPLSSRGRKPAKRAGGVEQDPAYLAWVRTLPCFLYAEEYPDCSGPSEAHHVGRRGMGQRSSDRETVALCHGHHMDYHANRGAFRMDKAARRAWCEFAVGMTQRQYREEFQTCDCGHTHIIADSDGGDGGCRSCECVNFTRRAA